MATHVLTGFAADDWLNVGGNLYRLPSGWTAPTDALTFTIRDDDSGFDGDASSDETGDDAGQTATVTDTGGATVASGRIYLESRFILENGAGTTINVYTVEIGGLFVGYVADTTLQPGETLRLIGGSDVTQNSAPGYASLADQTYDSAGDNSATTGSYPDSVDGGAGNDGFSGGDGNDTISGGSGDDTLAGGAGNDSLSGDSGSDVLDGGAGDDALTGGAGNDTLVGGSGDDTLAGGTGDDLIIGGAGADVFGYSAGDGADTITGFNAASSDFIDLSAFYDDVSELRAEFDDDGVLNQSNTLNDRGEAVDYSDNARFGPGGSIEIQGANSADLTRDSTNVICFCEGSLIDTPEGPRPVESLAPGDRVLTRDHGAQPVLWHGAREVPRTALERRHDIRPILLGRGTFGARADLCLSPQHCVLLDGWLVRAKFLPDLPGLGARVAHGKRRVRYHHILLPGHFLIMAQGVACESFYPGPMALKALDPDARAALFRVRPARPAAIRRSRQRLRLRPRGAGP